jgi:hypothetical protein
VVSYRNPSPFGRAWLLKNRNLVAACLASQRPRAPTTAVRPCRAQVKPPGAPGASETRGRGSFPSAARSWGGHRGGPVVSRRGRPVGNCPAIIPAVEIKHGAAPGS